MTNANRRPKFYRWLPALLLVSFVGVGMSGCPDVTSQDGIKLGDKHVAWNGSVVLTADDAFMVSGGRCAFNIEYDMANVGGKPAAPAFWNRLRTGSEVVTQQSNLTLATGEKRTIRTQGYLSPGLHTLTLSLDDEGDVREANETNNKLSATVKLQGPCVEQQACNTFHGFGRYDLRVDCDKVEIDGNVYVVERRGQELVVDGHTLARGIYRETRPWLYLHAVQGDLVDITFDSGRKEHFPIYTGSHGAIFETYSHPWEMERSTNALMYEGVWLVSHRWSNTGIFFDLQEDRGAWWNLARGDIFVTGDGTTTMIPELGVNVRVLSFDAAARKAMVEFTHS